MILLSDIFESLGTGELANTSSSEAGTIKETSYQKIISHINIGLKSLYQRFNLSEKFIYLHEQTNKTVYYLRSDYVGQYIEENPEYEFADDIITIRQIYNAEGELLPLNDKNDTTSIFTPSFDVLELTPADPLRTLKIVYQATHPRIRYTNALQPDCVELDFPLFLEEPLLLFVAAREMKSINMGRGQGQGQGEGSSLWAQFEMVCSRILMYNLTNRVGDTQQRFTNNSWV